MALGNDAHELDLGVDHIGHGLSGLGLREKNHKVNGVAGPQRDAHFRIRLEAADARAMAGTRIDDDEWPQCLVDADAPRRHDA